MNTTTATITDDQIEDIRIQAGIEGDWDTADACTRALGGDEAARTGLEGKRVESRVVRGQTLAFIADDDR